MSGHGRFYLFAKPWTNDRLLRSPDGWSKRSGHSRGRLKRRNAHPPGVFCTIKLFGQPQQTPAFSEPVRDGLRHAHFEDQAEPKIWFQLK